MTVRIVIEGEQAGRDADELATDSGLSAKVHIPAPRPGDKEPVTALTAVVTVISAAGGVAALVDSVLRWRDRLRKKHDTEPRIIVVVGDVRRPIDELSPDELTYLVERDRDTDA
jgi:hypothetical protein